MAKINLETITSVTIITSVNISIFPIRKIIINENISQVYVNENCGVLAAGPNNYKNFLKLIHTLCQLKESIIVTVIVATPLSFQTNK